MKDNIRLSFPIFLGQLGFSMMSFIDNILIGQLGTLSLSAFSLSSTVMFLAYALFVGFVIMFTPLIAQNTADRKILFSNGVVIYLILGIIVFLLLCVLGKFIFHLGQPAAVVKIARPYFEILMISFIPTFLFQILKQFSDGLSKTKIPMIFILFSLIINIILDYALLLGRFGLPKLGLMGTAWGTLISRCILFTTMLLYLATHKDTKDFFLSFFDFKIELKIIKMIFCQGFFSSIQVFFKIVLLTSTVILSGTLGTEIQASNQIFMNLSSLMFTVSFSLAAGSAIKSSIFVSENNTKESLRSAQLYLKLSLCSSLLFALILLLFSRSIALIYIKNPLVVQIVSNSLFLLVLFQFCSGAEAVLLGVLKGLMDTLIPLYLVAGAYFSALVLSFYLIKAFGFAGIWIGLICGVSASCLLLLRRAFFVHQELEKQQI